MEKTIRAKFSKGAIKPLEKLDLNEGEYITVTIVSSPRPEDTLNALRSTAGAWKGTHDPEELKRGIYADRLVRTRAETTL